MRKDLVILFGLLACVTLTFRSVTLTHQLTSIESLASQFASSASYPQYDMKTEQGINMDSVKAVKASGNKFLSVFHSSLEQKTSGYNALYLGQYKRGFTDSYWQKVVKLSEKGSKGYIDQIQYFAYVVLYEVQNHQKGNTIAIRYYQSYEKLIDNKFLYEYQIYRETDKKDVKYIGTPSIENITQIKHQSYIHFSQYRIYIKFHYSADGKKDQPGVGYINLKPLRDFVDPTGVWVGGSLENYGDWVGSTDTKVQQAIARLGPYNKIGQRDGFHLYDYGTEKWNFYYLYEVNMNSVFNWKDWRIVLYSVNDNRAIQIPFSFGQNENVASPHISFLSQDVGTHTFTFWLSFYLPSQGTFPDPDVKPGAMSAYITITA